MIKLKKILDAQTLKLINNDFGDVLNIYGAVDETRTRTPEVTTPQDSVSTNFTTPA